MAFAHVGQKWENQTPARKGPELQVSAWPDPHLQRDLNSREQGACQLEHMASVDIQDMQGAAILLTCAHGGQGGRAGQLLQEFQEKGH